MQRQYDLLTVLIIILQLLFLFLLRFRDSVKHVILINFTNNNLVPAV